ncbi:stress response protein NST1 [Monomorium pharaonis]|uniref:stress response protein NST1 n=1 Tax=Monomorium pharaonis TaxID=307658 RepID=UPI00063F6403|nr:stress response protein NST1 [Monomorium pharaonis]
MKNRLYDYICIFVVLEILQLSICHAKIINDTCRTKREISIVEIPHSKEDISYAKETNLEQEEHRDDDLEENTYQDDAKEKRKVSRKVANSIISADFYSNARDFSINRGNMSINSQPLNETLKEADKKETKRERAKNEEASNLVRLPRNINSDFDRYTDQNERLSLYDDYEAKDIAKRGVLNDEDYEEMEDESPEVSEDLAAVQGSTNESEKRELQKDTRVKRDQTEISEMLDISKSGLDDSAKLEESKTVAQNPYSRDVSRIELSKSFNEASAPDDVSKFKDFGSVDVISKSSDSSKIQEPASIVPSSKKDESNAQYEKRVEEEIQRKIDLIKEEIRRDIEIQQRIRDIEDNNARFDELQDGEHENERQNFENEPIEKRQTVAKRSIREIADNAASSNRNEEKRSSKKEHKKRQHRSEMIDKLDTSKEKKNLKKRFAANHDKFSEQIPAKGFLKKKRERVRQIFFNNDQHQTNKRQLRSYSFPVDRTAVRSERELFMNPDSHFRTESRMLKASLPVGSEDDNNKRKQNAAEHSDSLVSFAGSSQELNPRLEKEYKEAFGGLQSESDSALARFKRIKRVLVSPNVKI